MQPIYGHTSQATAFMIDDYPYGRTLRCRRRVWLESNPKHGFRFVSQTEHPTKKVWNKPHTSTYIETAACMFLDEQGHVGWTGVGIYTEPLEALKFARTFGPKCEGAERLASWAKSKAKLDRALGTGRAHITINGQPQERSETVRAEDLANCETWAEVAQLMGEGSA